MKKVRKAVTALVGSLITVVGVVVSGNPDWAAPEFVTPELVGVVGSALTTALTYFIPNDEDEAEAEAPAA